MASALTLRFMRLFCCNRGMGSEGPVAYVDVKRDAVPEAAADILPGCDLPDLGSFMTGQQEASLVVAARGEGNTGAGRQAIAANQEGAVCPVVRDDLVEAGCRRVSPIHDLKGVTCRRDLRERIR